MVQQSSAIEPMAQTQVVLITGSSGGIGASGVAAAQARGDLVIGTDRTDHAEGGIR